MIPAFPFLWESISHAPGQPPERWGSPLDAADLQKLLQDGTNVDAASASAIECFRLNAKDLNSRLLRAARDADLAECRKLLALGAQAPTGVSPKEQADALHAVIDAGDQAAEWMDLLLEWGFDPSCVINANSDGYESTPFISAVRARRIDLMEKLQAAGVDIHWKSPSGANAASAALPSRAFQDLRRDTPARQAVSRWLEARGVRIDPDCREMRRQIAWASYGPPSWPDVPMLIGLGVDPAEVGWTPLMMKIADGSATSDDIVAADREEFEVRDGYHRTPFLLAVSAGRRDLAEALAGLGADCRARGWCGATALHLAAREDHDEMLEWIAGLGVPVDEENDHHHTALREAVSCNQMKSAAMLLELGANPNAVDANGYQVIHDARSLEILQLLLKAGADVNSISGGGSWPLKDACEYGDPALVKFLLERGAEVNLTSTGETALFGAVASDSIECVSLLLEAGAEINATDVDGWTCLYLVHSLPMAELLLAKGADPGRTGMFGDLAENWARCVEVVELFREHRFKAEADRKGKEASQA